MGDQKSGDLEHGYVENLVLGIVVHFLPLEFLRSLNQSNENYFGGRSFFLN